MLKTFKDIFHILEAVSAEIFFGFPSKKIKIIGVTGTDGKTTTTHAIYHFLKTSGKKVSMISSIYADIGGKTADTGFHTTTPRPWKIRHFLKQAIDAGSEYFILETTSHAIAQNRIWGIPFEVAVLTNITREHTLEHGSFDEYVAVKTSLLLQANHAIVNANADIFSQVEKILRKKGKSFVTFSLNKRDVSFSWNDNYKTKITEAFNRENLLGAIACCKTLGLSDEEIYNSLPGFKLPQGRLDIVYDNEFMVIVDFAHTPNAIEQVLKAVKKDLLKKSGRIIHVFGAASERDDSKRPLMGEASGEYADLVILTEEDYRRENIEHIWSQIAEGLMKKGFEKVSPDHIQNENDKVFTTVKDRGEAINLGISLAKKEDIVISTGKSHEKSLNRDGVEKPWDEYEAIKSALESKN